MQWRAKLQMKIAATLPVWAKDHWTLLMLSRDDVLKDDWVVEYKDSLTIQSDACAETAKKLLQIASAATGKDLALPQRSNQCMQPKFSGACGYYVAHWIDAKMREVYNKEPKMSTGIPNLEAMRKRLMSMVDMARACLDWLKDNQEKMEAHVAKEDAEKKDAEAIATAIKESLDMQAQVARKTQTLLNKDTWDAKWGCAQCHWAKKGSTCCNPHKKMARLEAEEAYAKDHEIPWEAGKYEESVYKAFYGKIREKILAEHAQRCEEFFRLPDCRAKDAPPAPAAEDGAEKPVAEDALVDKDLSEWIGELS